MSLSEFDDFNLSHHRQLCIDFGHTFVALDGHRDAVGKTISPHPQVLLPSQDTRETLRNTSNEGAGVAHATLKELGPVTIWAHTKVV